jgi:hypothetical protein
LFGPASSSSFLFEVVVSVVFFSDIFLIGWIVEDVLKFGQDDKR